MTAFKNTVAIQVRFSDVDMLGHVSNTVYQTYFDTGKTSYFDEVIGAYDFKKEAFVGASIKIEYLKPIFMRTNIYVQSRISRIGNKSFDFEHRLVNACNGEILSTCLAVMVCFDPSTQKSIPIPSEWRTKIMAYENL